MTNYRRWTKQEEEYLMKQKGTLPIKTIAKVLDRTPQSCYSKIKSLKNNLEHTDVTVEKPVPDLYKPSVWERIKRWFV